MINLRFLGYGGAFDFEFGNSAALVEKDDVKLLLDCGFTVYPILRHHELVDDLTHVMITHLHDDHCGSLSALLFHRFFAPGSEPLTLVYPTEEFRRELLAFLKHTMVEPEKYFKMVSADEMGFIEAIDITGRHADLLNYSYIFRDDDGTIVYSSDLKDVHYLVAELHKRSIIGTVIFHDVSFNNNPAHAYYKEVQKYADQYEIIGYHHDLREKPDDCTLQLVSERPEYLYS